MDYRADDFMAFLGQKITVSAVDLLDDAVSPEYAEAMCYPGSEAPFECYILVTGKEDVCYVSVSKSVDVELTMADGLEKVRVICGPGAQGGGYGGHSRIPAGKRIQPNRLVGAPP